MSTGYIWESISSYKHVVTRVTGRGQLVDESEVEAQPDCVPDEVIDHDISSHERLIGATVR